MTRCIDFYEKWEKEPNFCEMTASSMSRINGYIELIEKLEKEYDLPRKLTIGKLSEGAARPVATLRDGEFKNAAVKIIAARLRAPAGQTYPLRGTAIKDMVDSLTTMPPSQQEGSNITDASEPVHNELPVPPEQPEPQDDFAYSCKKEREAWANAREKANEKEWTAKRDKEVYSTIDSVIKKMRTAINADLIDAMTDVGEREHCYEGIKTIRDHCDNALNGRTSARFVYTCSGWKKDSEGTNACK